MKIKNALIVENKPLYQLLVLEQKHPHYRKLLKSRHPSTKKWKAVYDQHVETLEGVQRMLYLLGISADRIYRKDLKKVGAYDLVITIGGDGTFLETSHYLDRQVLLGVNAAPMDSTGALCGARLDNFLSVMIDLMTGVLKPKRIPRLKVQVGKKVLPYPGLNEVLFANRSPAGTSRYWIQVGGQQEEHKSSGVWVATGAGSTAAICSAGGKVLPPTDPRMQYLVREPLILKGQNFKLQKGILPKGKRIVFTSTTRQSAVFVDGNHLEVGVEYGEKVVVSASGKPLKAVL